MEALENQNSTDRRKLEARLRHLDARIGQLEADLGPLQEEARVIRRLLRRWEAPGRGEDEDLDDGRRRALPGEIRHQQVLALVQDRPEQLRRIDLARLLGLKKARAGQIVNELIKEGSVEDAGNGLLTAINGGQR